MSHNTHSSWWHEREPSMCAGCEREHYERRRAEEDYERAAHEHAQESNPTPNTSTARVLADADACGKFWQCEGMCGKDQHGIEATDLAIILRRAPNTSEEK